MIFASGGLGGAADGQAMVCIASMGLLVAIIVATNGIMLVRTKRKLLRRCGVVLILVSITIPIFVCSGFKAIPSRSALQNKIEIGMTKQEVIDVAGEPTTKQSGYWTYTTDYWGIGFFIVNFDKLDRVEKVWVD